jgi:aryl-alcohol dehydrogenase-like predicted oxidoreductase
MNMRFLGKTGIKVSELCLGAGNFGSIGLANKHGEISQKEADLMVSMAIDAGINFFNTAQAYNNGVSEEILGKALGNKRKNVILTTKVTSIKFGESEGNLSRSNIIDGCASSLKRLNTDYIDLYELHNFDENTPLEETLQAMEDLVRQGKVRYIGCSNFTGWQLMKALAISDKRGWESFIVLECLYSLLARGAEFELIPLCLDQGLSVVAWSPLHGGFLSGKYRRGQTWPKGTRLTSPDDKWVSFDLEKGFDTVEELYNIAGNHGVTVSQTALNYLLNKRGVTSLIIGARKAEQLADNIKTTTWSMAADEVSRLDNLTEPVDIYPYGSDMPSRRREKENKRN